MTNDETLLQDIFPVEDSVEVGEGTIIALKCLGTLRAGVKADEIAEKIPTEGVTFVPNICKNLLSVSFLRQKRLEVTLAVTK